MTGRCIIGMYRFDRDVIDSIGEEKRIATVMKRRDFVFIMVKCHLSQRSHHS